MSTFKYQEQFASELTEAWLAGKRVHVRTTIRNLKNKAQAAYIAASVATQLQGHSLNKALAFVEFIHPNNR